MKKGIWIFSLLTFLVLFPDLLPGQEEENLRRVIDVLDELQLSDLQWSDGGIPAGSFSVEERSLLADYGGFGSSLLVSRQIAESGGTFVFAVPLDAQFAVDTALSMVEKLTNSKVNILVAFLSGERNELPKDLGGITHKGLRDLLTLTDMPENRLICYFDADKTPDELVIFHGSRGYLAPLETIRPLPNLFSSRNIPWSFKIRHNTIFKLGLVEGHEAMSIIWGEEINSFVILGETINGKAGKAISPEELSVVLLEYAGALRFPVVNTDKHYSVFSFPNGRVFFVRELVIVILLIITAGLVLILYLLYSSRYNAILLFHIRLFIRYFWLLFLFFLLLVITFRLLGLIYSLLVSILVLGLLSNPSGERFYGFGSVIIAVSGLLYAVFIDISHVPLFLWVFFFVFIASSISNPKHAFLSVFFIPLYVFAAMFNVFEADSENFNRLFLSSGHITFGTWTLALQFSLIFSPVLLLVKRALILMRISLYLPHKAMVNKIYRYVFLCLLFTAALVTMIQNLFLQRNHISFDRRYIAEAPETGEILMISLSDIVFQDSRIVTLTLAAKGLPLRFDVSIASGSEKNLLPIYALPVPFEREDEGRRITLSLGEHPPNPLTIEIV
ncbi:MAG: hypothetical protein LBH42_09610, partial [Treponema sp.]|nr:hypothetical protein [Treponema sp.]